MGWEASKVDSAAISAVKSADAAHRLARGAGQ